MPSRLFKFLSLGWLAACGSSATPDCPNDLPPSCTAALHYEPDIAPVVAQNCLSCHTGATSTRLDTYERLHTQRSAVLNQVYACRMPRDGELSQRDRALLLAWLVCEAPQ